MLGIWEIRVRSVLSGFDAGCGELRLCAVLCDGLGCFGDCSLICFLSNMGRCKGIHIYLLLVTGGGMM